MAEAQIIIPTILPVLNFYNSFQSSISYSTSIGDKCNFSLSGSDNQNMLTHAIDLTLPEFTFSVANIYPFRSKLAVWKA